MINKINIQEPEQRRAMRAPDIRAILFSSICFFLAIAGVIASGVVLQHANGPQALQVGGVIGLFSSTLIALVCAASVAITVVSLARPYITRS
jgi:hypothetical protein